MGCDELAGSPGVRATRLPLETVQNGSRAALGSFTAASVWENAPQDAGRPYSAIPFSPRASWALGPDRIFVSEGVHYEVRVYGESGQLVGIWRERESPPELSARDRALHLERQLAAGQPQPTNVPLPDRLGAYDRLVWSHDGELWARHMRGPGDTHGRWTVFSSEGDGLRRMLLPDVEVTAVRDGRIYGTVRDELDVTSAVVLEILARR